MSQRERASVPSKAVYVLVVPGFADWEPAHALAELRRHGGYRVEVVGLTMAPVESMGGLMVQPKRALADVDLTDVAAFILPGGDRWESSPMEPELAEFLQRLETAHIPLAAICAATVAITRAGLLHGRRHTSNGQDYLRHHVPGYEGAADYVDAPAVRDRGLITASGLADVEFAAELLDELNVLGEKERKLWVELFRGGRIPSRVA
jgi:putative intracellular protease/amidase